MLFYIFFSAEDINPQAFDFPVRKIWIFYTLAPPLASWATSAKSFTSLKPKALDGKLCQCHRAFVRKCEIHEKCHREETLAGRDTKYFSF